jgi:NitT/TauT family transport system permease protein
MSARRASFGFVLAAGTLGVWQLAALASKPLFLPGPLLVWNALGDLTASGALLGGVTASYGRILAGWLIGSALGAPIGLLMARSAVVRFVCDPILQVFRFLPAVAILPLLVLWLGSGEVSKLVLIAYATCFVVALAALDGARRVDLEKIRAARSLGASERQIFRLVILPASLPSIVTGMRLGMTGAFLAIVTAEMLAANEGLGFLIANARLYLLTPRIFVAIAALGCLGLLSDAGIRFASRRLGYRYQVHA